MRQRHVCGEVAKRALLEHTTAWLCVTFRKLVRPTRVDAVGIMREDFPFICLLGHSPRHGTSSRQHIGSVKF